MRLTKSTPGRDIGGEKITEEKRARRNFRKSRYRLKGQAGRSGADRGRCRQCRDRKILPTKNSLICGHLKKIRRRKRRKRKQAGRRIGRSRNYSQRSAIQAGADLKRSLGGMFNFLKKKKFRLRRRLYLSPPGLK